MAEYIEREYAVDAVLDVYYDTPDIDLSGEKFEAAIRKIQAADVATVRHGRWIAIKVPNEWDRGQCSECRSIFNSSVWGTNYCPNCGCKMDLEESKNAKQP